MIPFAALSLFGETVTKSGFGPDAQGPAQVAVGMGFAFMVQVFECFLIGFGQCRNQLQAGILPASNALGTVTGDKRKTIMQQKSGSRFGSGWFLKISFLSLLLVASPGSHSAFADPTPLQGLDLKMTMATSTHISLGEPIVIHYTLKNVAPVGQVTFHAGQKNNEWYTFSLADAQGKIITAAPPHSAEETQGLQHTSEASIPNGNSTEGDLVVTRYLAVPGPGIYTLTVHAMTPYYVEPDGSWYPQGRPSNIQKVNLTPNFRFPLTVTSANPAVIRATAEALRMKLMDVRCVGQWASLTEQLFSLPETEALPTWEELLTDNNTNDLVLRNGADQLASQPSPVHADLLAEALWEGTKPMDTFAHPWVSRTLFKMYETATGPLKEHIRSLYTAHGDSSIVQNEEMKAKRPN